MYPLIGFSFILYHDIIFQNFRLIPYDCYTAIVFQIFYSFPSQCRYQDKALAAGLENSSMQTNILLDAAVISLFGTNQSP